tara:strand:- start:7661 stop:8326 length:666 start_codon:yes stop_codon:yes gene_type:complete
MGESTRVDEVTPILEIGLVIAMKLRDEKYDATICGWKSGTFVLVDCHAVNSGALKVAPDTNVVIRLINKGFVLSCSTTIMSILKPPINLIVLDFPTRYEKMSIRKHPRLDISLPALFNDLSASTPEARNVRNKATTLDLSLGGALIASKHKLQVHQRIALSIKLSTTEKITNIISIVKSLSKDKKVGSEIYHLAGVEYENLPEENKAKLVTFIEASRPFRS